MIPDTNSVPIVSFQSAPPVKGAMSATLLVGNFRKFQSAPPVKGAMEMLASLPVLDAVSIRAPREGGD